MNQLSTRYYILLVLLVCGLLTSCSKQTLRAASEAPPPATKVSYVSDTPGIETSYADVVARVAPAVVTIRSERRVHGPEQFPFSGLPFFGQMERPREDRVEHGLGSGVIVSADGYILTNHHVVNGAEDIRVELSDNRTLTAKVTGSDAPSDLALLKIDANSLPVLPLGDSNNVRVGDIVLAIGNPLGVGQTVTMGIISAKGRQTGLSDGSFEDFLQTDAPINQGNSGGALVNSVGELIGINSQIISPSGGNIGIGFAVPTNMARTVMDQLMKSGIVRRAMLGVSVQPVTADLASSLGLSEIRGALVNAVQQDGPAERAGIRRGDVIVALNGSPVADSNSLRNQIANSEPGGEVTLTILRDKQEQQIRARLAELPASKKTAAADSSGDDDTGKLGINVQPLTPELAARLKLPAETQGLVVTDVDKLGAAADAGLRQGDVIAEANRQPVRSLANLQSVIKTAGSKPLLLLINRGGATLFVTVRMRQ